MGRERVLVAEPDLPLRRFLERVLARAGYEAASAADGAEAEGLLARETFDVLAAEARLGSIGGIELLERIERGDLGRSAGGTGPRVVLTSACAGELALVEALRAGAVRVLAKPFGPEDFLGAVAAAAREASRVPAGPEDVLRVSRGLRGWVELTAPSRRHYVARLETFLEQLAGTRLPPGARNALALSISEIIANAIEWGRPGAGEAAGAGRATAGSPGAGTERARVRISYCLFPAEVVLCVEDEGGGFNPEAVPDPSRDPVGHIAARLAAGKRIGGYGLHLVRAQMDRVLFNRQGNVVLLSKRLEA